MDPHLFDSLFDEDEEREKAARAKEKKLKASQGRGVSGTGSGLFADAPKFGGSETNIKDLGRALLTGGKAVVKGIEEADALRPSRILGDLSQGDTESLNKARAVIEGVADAPLSLAAGGIEALPGLLVDDPELRSEKFGAATQKVADRLRETELTHFAEDALGPVPEGFRTFGRVAGELGLTFGGASAIGKVPQVMRLNKVAREVTRFAPVDFLFGLDRQSSALQALAEAKGKGELAAKHPLLRASIEALSFGGIGFLAERALVKSALRRSHAYNVANPQLELALQPGIADVPAPRGILEADPIYHMGEPEDAFEREVGRLMDDTGIDYETAERIVNSGQAPQRLTLRVAIRPEKGPDVIAEAGEIHRLVELRTGVKGENGFVDDVGNFYSRKEAEEFLGLPPDPTRGTAANKGLHSFNLDEAGVPILDIKRVPGEDLMVPDFIALVERQLDTAGLHVNQGPAQRRMVAMFDVADKEGMDPAYVFGTIKDDLVDAGRGDLSDALNNLQSSTGASNLDMGVSLERASSLALVDDVIEDILRDVGRGLEEAGFDMTHGFTRFKGELPDGVVDFGTKQSSTRNADGSWPNDVEFAGRMIDSSTGEMVPVIGRYVPEESRIYVDGMGDEFVFGRVFPGGPVFHEATRADVGDRNLRKGIRFLHRQFPEAEHLRWVREGTTGGEVGREVNLRLRPLRDGGYSSRILLRQIALAGTGGAIGAPFADNPLEGALIGAGVMLGTQLMGPSARHLKRVFFLLGSRTLVPAFFF